MSIGRLTGRASLDGQDLGWGTCDRCGKLTNIRDLEWQWAWAGFSLINLKLRVCTVSAGSCVDVPNETLRAIVIPPDPIPIQNPRPPFWQIQSAEGALINYNPVA